MRRGDLFVLSWESLHRVEWGKVSSFLSMSDLCLIQPAYSVLQHIDVKVTGL